LAWVVACWQVLFGKEGKMSEYTEEDAARDTGSSATETARAWYDAQKDAAKDGDWGVSEDRHDNGGGVLGSIIDFMFGK